MNLIWIVEVVVMLGFAGALIYTLRGSARTPRGRAARVAPKAVAQASPEPRLELSSASRPEIRQTPKI